MRDLRMIRFWWQSNDTSPIFHTITYFQWDSNGLPVIAKRQYCNANGIKHSTSLQRMAYVSLSRTFLVTFKNIVLVLFRSFLSCLGQSLGNCSISSQTHDIALRTIRTSDYSYPGLFVLWVDYSYLGRFVQWTIRTTNYSYYGLFVPSVKYSHNINCWCRVPPGAHPTGHLSNASRPITIT